MIEPTPKQTFIGVWFHEDTLSDDEKDHIKLHLSRTFYYYRIFDDEAEFTGYIVKERIVAKIFLIISDEELYNSFTEMAQSDNTIFQKIYVFLPTNPIMPRGTSCFTTSCSRTLFEQLLKDILEFTNHGNQPTALEDRACIEPDPVSTCQVNPISPSLSVFNRKYQRSTPIRHLTKESLNFLRFLAMTDILITQTYNSEELSETWNAYCEHYAGNDDQTNKIRVLQSNYEPCNALEYYTDPSLYLSRVINQACHTENMQQIFSFRAYIRDLHKSLDDRHGNEEHKAAYSCIEKVYRGKPLSGSVLQQLIDNEDGLISMNGFLSTTMSEDIALKFAGYEQQTSEGYKKTLFLLNIDKKVTKPYAYIADVSAVAVEDEVLFSLSTIWRIRSVAHDKDPCKIILSSCDNADLQLIEPHKKDMEKRYRFLTLGDISHEMGNNDEAEWFYDKMLKQSSITKETRGILHYKIGMIQNEKGLSVALENFEKAASFLRPQTTNSDKVGSSLILCMPGEQTSLVAIYNNMGLIHAKNDRFDEATNCYEQALEVQNGSKSEIAKVHYNLAELHSLRRNFDEAREHYEKAVKLIDASDPMRLDFERKLEEINDLCQPHAKKQRTDQQQRTTVDN